jgi:diguanylate cyclase (GGDEF)-like protein
MDPGRVLTNGGLLLDHFARLATNLAGASAAVVGVIGRRRGIAPRRAAYGLSREQTAELMQIEAILEDDGPGLTVVPDMALDERFAAAALDDFRFLAHMRLMSPGGERVGFIWLLDQKPRAALTERQVASLDQIASMIMADRQREQRHRHLMHVADRALRVDRMLRLVSDAASCADALSHLLEALCHFHGAAVGQIWQLIQPDRPLLEISHYHEDPGQDPHRRTNDVHAPTEPPAALHEMPATLHEMTAGAIRRNKPHAIKLSRLEPFEAPTATGLTGHVCIPIWVHQQRFGISLAFTTENSDLDSVVADIASLGDTIRPALYQKVTEERMRFAAHHDDLTQLSNRLMFQERLRKAIASARAVEQRFAVLCLDLDGFKQINDTRGHEIGDRLLVGVAQRLRDSVRETDTVARMGGDEFAIIQPLDSQPVAALALAKRLIDTVPLPFELSGRPALVGVSIGIALYPDHGESPDLLLRHADQALYRAKKSGRKTFCLFDPAMEANSHDLQVTEQNMRDGMIREEFTLAYQPVCDCGTLRIVGFEALLRWRHPTLGSIPPDVFIPLAEKSGLIIPLGRWALETACAEAVTWDPRILLSVNLSPLQFRQPDLPRQVAEVLRQTGLPAERLRLEVTEGLLLDESDLVLRTMRELQEQGIRIMLDDFGTAYASMSYLRRFPFNGIKIDKTFVSGLCDDEVALAIVQAILSLGQRLNLAVVAEGVETERQLAALRGLGCRFFQGYLAGRPSDSRQTRALPRVVGLEIPVSS